MEVRLIAYTPDPEKVVAAAARLCYSSAPADQVLEGMTEDRIASFLQKLVEMGHESPIEHVSFTFTVTGVSRSLSHQLVRHRIASYSQKSQRYVKESGFDYITPPSISRHPQASKIFTEEMEHLRQAYDRLAALVPAEDARFVLPNACETQLVVTMNARSLINFFRLRCCSRAQWEIRRLATAMLKEVRKVAPNLFANAGPPCQVDGRCNQGEMSCGRWLQLGSHQAATTSNHE